MSEKLSKIIGKRRLIVDGAIGTVLQKRMTEAYDCPEELNITHPEIMISIHEDYLKAGCDLIETNTFGANTLILDEYGLAEKAYEFSLASAKIVKKLTDKYSTDKKPCFTLGSIGPGSKLPSLGDVDFDTLKTAYIPQVNGLIDGGVDGFLIETSQDVLQIKAVLDAIFDLNTKKLPVMVSVTIDESGKMLPGTDLTALMSIFSAYPLASLGLNCGFGPKELRPYVKTLAQNSPFPVSIMPNAGLPQYDHGSVVYPMQPKDFSRLMSHIAIESGCEIMGGCCGTTPEHLKMFINDLNDAPLRKIPEYKPTLASLFSVQDVDTNPKPLIVGERTNVTGSKKFREAMLSNNPDDMMAIARQQIDEGAHVLDISLSYTGRDEVKDMLSFIQDLNKESLIPLQPDTSSPQVMEAALKCISGRAVINSVNLENGEAYFLKVARLCRRFGAMLICLTIDEKGMAKTSKEKVLLAQRMIDLAGSAGLRQEDLFIDTLTFTLGSGDEASWNTAQETLQAIKSIKTTYPLVYTVLGVSNISYGLKPSLRKALNAIFLYKAVEAGLDAAIVHAGKLVPVSDIPERIRIACSDLIDNQRNNSDPLEDLLQYGSGFNVKPAEVDTNQSPQEQLIASVIHGDKKHIVENLEILKKSHEAKDLINDFMMAGMKEVGRRFNDGSMQLPFVLKAASAMQTGIQYLRPFLKQGDAPESGTILVATVKGDVHDIGKNLVKIVFESHGYKVHDLGVKQPVQALIHAYETYKPDMIGMSGLLVQSAHVMKENLQAFAENNISVPVLIGGAALTKEYVETELQSVYPGQVYYAADAFRGLQISESMCEND